MNNSEIKIVKIEPKDWLLYKEIRLESLRMEPQAFNSKYHEVLAKPDSFWVDELSNLNQIYLFGMVGDEVVGTMNIHFNENDVKNEAIIHGAYVNISHRRKGIGRQMLSRLLDEAHKKNGIQKVSLKVKGSQIKARKFYESMGFSVTGKDDSNILTMEKSLN